MATVYTLLASQVPVPVVPAALLSITGAVPNVASVVVVNATGAGSLSTPFNRNAVRIDALGRAGAGAYAIDWDSNPASAVLPGLDLTVSAGLTLAIAAGQAVLDSAVQKLAPTTLALTDNIARIYLYLGNNGVVTPVNNSLVPPAGIQAFIGSVVTNAGAITEINGSGVCYFKGSQIWRFTADVGCPSDTPPAGLSFFNQCIGGLYYWNGASYDNLTGAGFVSLTFASDANKTLTPSQYSNRELSFANSGTALSTTRNVIVPLTPAGRHWTIVNNSAGGQSIQVIGPSGTGVTIATGKYADVRSNGTNILRVTPDT